jgi:hypothetical protein
MLIRPAVIPNQNRELPRREWMSVPCPGSMPYESDRLFWDRIASKTCERCKSPIGYGCGVYVYSPSGSASHIRCTDDAEADAIALRSNAFMIDAASKLAGISQEGFIALAIWEKDRLIAQVQENNTEAHPC